MSAVPVLKPSTETRAKVIDLSSVIKRVKREEETKHNKDGSINRVKPHKVAGVSSEVYAFQSEMEIKAMIDMLDNKIDNAPDDDKRRIAARNKMLFVLGINLGVRASDLCELQYSFFMNNDGTFKEFYSLQPKKTKKTKKFVKLYFNQTVKKAITDYIEEYPIEDMNEYLFKSRVGDGHITEKSLGRIIKDTAAEVGIERNICSHSLRKTFGYFVYHNAEDKNNALVILQTIFNHSSPAITSKYIGLTDTEISDVFNTLNLGDEFI